MPLIGNTARLVRQMDLSTQSKLKKVYWRSDNNEDKPRIVKHGRSFLSFGLKGVEPEPQNQSVVRVTPKLPTADKRVSEPIKDSVWKNGKYYSKNEEEF